MKEFSSNLLTRNLNLNLINFYYTFPNKTLKKKSTVASEAEESV